MATSRVIGLDIASTCVRAAELEFGSGGPAGKNPPTLVRYGQTPLPIGAVRDGEVVQPETVATALRQLWAQTKFESKDVVIGVGNQRVIVRELDLPWMPLAQLKESLPYQVNELLPMSTDDALLDYFPTSESEGPQGRTVHGMLVAAQRDTVTANVLTVEAAGLRPSMVDLNAFALHRALARGDALRGTAAFVDIGATITTVVISAKGSPKLVRSLPTGGQHVTNAVASALGIAGPEAELLKREVGIGFAVAPEREDAAEAVAGVVRALVESVRNTFVYYASNHPGAGIDVVVLTGGGTHLPGLGQYISSASRLPVTLGDPLAGLRSAKTVQREALNGHESLIALPVGLAYGVAA
ncbi:type 4 fimbrial biogenesis protein PilM [Cellulomonas chitinilytica]|uniref:Type 4 fimbrial biogenesis protein PilM n=1 Tax=Cellulomonas chitinilytica TaxID=398759 RepID=A0A919U0F0_9CELL|nr:type IV pilus assembly protein PilM [Cellulomonas chitinilytica]GIG20376.1 type 4 fimbrial biogenesis protein PilM [Cellulomonas chitinilytica]